VLKYEAGRFGKVVHDAFFDWQTIGPLVGAAVFAVDDFDERASDWATNHTPIFGSVDDAKDASDDLKDVLRFEAVATLLLTPSGDEVRQWANSKAKGAGVEVGAYLLTDSLTSGLKDWTSRQRPDKSSDRSFPSAHTSQAFALATLSNRNLDYIDVPWGLRRPLQVTNIAVASGVAWARVEGQRHYPSDVLFGAALGHFATRIIHD
jgi:membrane-associated phospholipid phosphatase